MDSCWSEATLGAVRHPAKVSEKLCSAPLTASREVKTLLLDIRDRQEQLLRHVLNQQRESQNPWDTLKTSRSVHSIAQEKTLESTMLRGTQSERRLHCKTSPRPEFRVVSPWSIWQQQCVQQDTGEPANTTMFHSLLQQLELQYRHDLHSSRSDTEKQCKNDVDWNWQVTAGAANTDRSVPEAKHQSNGSTEPSIALDTHEASSGFQRCTSPASAASDDSLQRRHSWTDASDHVMKSSIRAKLQRAGSLTSIGGDDEEPQPEPSRLDFLRHKLQAHEIFLWITTPTAESQMSRCRFFANKVVNLQTFDSLCTGAIILNASILGVTTDIAAKNADPDGIPEFFEYIDFFFAAWFLAELLLRIIAGGFNFVIGENRNWNLFDLLVVSTDSTNGLVSFVRQKP